MDGTEDGVIAGAIEIDGTDGIEVGIAMHTTIHTIAGGGEITTTRTAHKDSTDTMDMEVTTGDTMAMEIIATIPLQQRQIQKGHTMALEGMGQELHLLMVDQSLQDLKEQKMVL